MRLFVAISASEDIRVAVSDWRGGYSDLPVRWTKDKNLHMTVIPPWEAEDAAPFLKRLESCQHGRFEVSFSKISFSSGLEGNPRLIWASGPYVSGLESLTDSVSVCLGIERPHRKILPHITLARFDPRDFPSFPVKDISDDISWIEEVREVVLMSSRRGPSGADYDILGGIELNG